ncbi:MAG: hypothetical protein L7W95_09585 [Alphaproteobacteria bacterium]|nr:hypothetical protein [Alphaproteobacteria bacterium]
MDRPAPARERRPLRTETRHHAAPDHPCRHCRDSGDGAGAPVPRLSMQLRARLRGVLGSPFVRQILFGVVLRIIRLLLFRR